MELVDPFVYHVTPVTLLRPDHGAPINTLKCVGEAMGTAQPVGGVHA